MPERDAFDGSPLLTKSQRRYLWERAHEDRDDDRRQRSRIRKRVQGVVSDFEFLFRYLSPEDRASIFEELEEFAEWRAEERERMAEADSDELHGRVPTNQSEAAEVGEDLYRGVTGALGFLYAGVGNTSDFEAILENAVAKAGRQEGDLLDVDVSIKYTREADRDDVLDRWDAGELSREEQLEALDLDPTLMFDSRFRSDDE